MEELREIFKARGASYSDFADNSRVCQDLRRALGRSEAGPVGVDDTTANGIEMIRHKLSRLATSGWQHHDSWIDLAGFAILVAADQMRQKVMSTSVATPEWGDLKASMAGGHADHLTSLKSSVAHPGVGSKLTIGRVDRNDI